MSEPGFLGRWSRRKATARHPAAIPTAAASPPELPPVESLGAGSDFAAFLQQGVAAELQRRALAVAWRSDAAITEFRGMADYDWDFNAPTYGRLWASDDAAKLLAAVMTPPAVEPLPEPPPIAVAAEPEPERDRDGPDAEVHAAEQPPPPPRRHGRAMPT